MKKIALFSLCLASNFVMAGSDITDNLYIQADIGSANLYLVGEEVPGSSDLHKSTISQRFSIGMYNTNNFRVALDYTNFNKVKLRLGNDNLTLKLKSLGVSGMYDFDVNGFLPYLGVRIALNKPNYFDSTDNDYYYIKDDLQLGYGVLAGIQYKINKNVYVNLGTEYNVLSSDVHQFGGNLGVRINF